MLYMNKQIIYTIFKFKKGWQADTGDECSTVIDRKWKDKTHKVI